MKRILRERQTWKRATPKPKNAARLGQLTADEQANVLAAAAKLLLAVAALGGHIKWSGDPGWLTLGRGYADLLLLTAGWEAAKLQQARDQR